MMFESNKIKFNRPMLPNGEVDDSFYSILVLHQNRYKGINSFSKRDSITDETIPDWFDLAIWGHEHECTGVRHIESTNVHILQPGSTVITSLVDGEQVAKKSWLLQINKELFNLQGIKLKTQRKFIYRSVALANTAVRKDSKAQVENYLRQEIKSMLDTYDTEVAASMTVDEMRDPKFSFLNLPQVRIRVDYSGGYSTTNLTHFSGEFKGKVANPSDFIYFYKLKTNEEKISRKDREYATVKGGLQVIDEANMNASLQNQMLQQVSK